MWVVEEVGSWEEKKREKVESLSTKGKKMKW